MFLKDGIDIACFQHNVNYEKVAASKAVSFVILREGYDTKTDSEFDNHVAGFKRVGIPIIGIYHFAYITTKEEAIDEAERAVANAVRVGLDPRDVVIYYDFEYDTLKNAKRKGVTLTPEQCNEYTIAFCEKVEELGFKAGVYTNIDFHDNWYDASTLERYSLWLADYCGKPDYDCDIRQYTSRGHVPGITGYVDMNTYMNKDPEKKPIDVIAREVIEGEWGNGQERIDRLTAAGYDADAVQNLVNQMLGYHKPVTDEIAKEVIRGEWGNGQDRFDRLTAAGYDADAVQERVNQILGHGADYDIDQLAREVIQGKWGNEPVRSEKLIAAGYPADKIQERVNEILRG